EVQPSRPVGAQEVQSLNQAQPHRLAICVPSNLVVEEATAHLHPVINLAVRLTDGTRPAQAGPAETWKCGAPLAPRTHPHVHDVIAFGGVNRSPASPICKRMEASAEMKCPRCEDREHP